MLVQVVSIDYNEMYPKVTGTLEWQLSYESDRSEEQRRKYAVITNLGAESDFAALNSNFCYPSRRFNDPQNNL